MCKFICLDFFVNQYFTLSFFQNLQDDSGRFNSENHLKMRGEAELGRANSVEGGDEDPTAD